MDCYFQEHCFGLVFCGMKFFRMLQLLCKARKPTVWLVGKDGSNAEERPGPWFKPKTTAGAESMDNREKRPV